MRVLLLLFLPLLGLGHRTKHPSAPTTRAPSVSPITAPTVSASTDYYEAFLYYAKAAFNYAVAEGETGYEQQVDLANAQGDERYAKVLKARAEKIVE
jgi:hypothetical protein